MKRTKLRLKSLNNPKDDIQEWVRLIVTKRDGGCILRDLRHCGALAEVIDDKVVSDTTIQADHLVTRANGATFADTRLIVCLCKGCHGWKHWHKDEYDDLIKTILPKPILKLWAKCEADYRAHKTKKMDWAMELVALKQEYAKL